MLDDDDEPIKDVIAVGLQNLVEKSKNPLSDYNEAFRNLQARQRMNPVTPGLAKMEIGATEPTEATTLYTAIDISQQQEGASELAASMDNVNIDSKTEDTVDNDGSRPTMSIFKLYQPGEAESTFGTMGADDVALDIDTEVGYITEDELSDESEDSMYEMS